MDIPRLFIFITIMCYKIFFVFTVLELNCLVYAEELDDNTVGANINQNLSSLISKLGLSEDVIFHLLSESNLSEDEKVALRAVRSKLPELMGTNFLSLDPRFEEGISEKELVDFLLELGTNELSKIKYDFGNTNYDDDIEEITTYGYSFGSISEDPAEFSVEDITYMRNVRRRANELYRLQRYDEAYPILLNLAKRGFRDAQSRISYILFNGTSTIEKSNLRALGWLGVASAHPTEPGFIVLYNKYMMQVPHDMLPKVKSIVDDFRERYSHSRHLSCSVVHPYTKRLSSNMVKRTYCRFRIESIADACFPYRCRIHAVNSKSRESDDLELESLDNRVEEVLYLEHIESTSERIRDLIDL